MNKIEFIFHSKNFFHENQMMRELVDGIWRESQGFRTGRNQSSLSQRVTAGEKSDFMSQPDQFFGKVRYNSFCAPVQSRRNAFIEGCDLSDTQDGPLS